MKVTINFDDFIDAFEKQGYKNNFSREGLNYLYNHLTETEEDTGQEIELDAIAFCCEFGENTIEDFADNYSINLQEVENHEAVIKAYGNMVLSHAW